jgi:hypothetical protein
MLGGRFAQYPLILIINKGTIMGPDELIGKIKASLGKLIYLVTEYGIKESGYLKDKNYDNFIQKVHEGYYLAQDEIIRYILETEEVIDELVNKKKEYRRQKKRENENEISTKIRIIEYYSFVLRKIADVIAWSIFVDLHIAKQFYIGEELVKLKSSNIESIIKYISIQKKDLTCFSLVCDITGFIQIGDIIRTKRGKEDKGVEIIELKEGEVNSNILSLFSDKLTTRNDWERFFNKYGKSGIKQAERVVRQNERAQNTLSLITTDKGYDPIMKLPKTLSKEVLELSFYVDRIANLLKKLEKKDWAIDIVQDSLYIGCYNNNAPWLSTFTYWVNGECHKPIIVDWKTVFYIPVVSSPFLYPFGINKLCDIINGKIKIYLALDMPKFLNIAHKYGATWSYISEKEISKKGYNSLTKKGLVRYEDKYISVSYNGHEMFVGNGITTRILFDFTEPESAFRVLIHEL